MNIYNEIEFGDGRDHQINPNNKLKSDEQKSKSKLMSSPKNKFDIVNGNGTALRQQTASNTNKNSNSTSATDSKSKRRKNIESNGTTPKSQQHTATISS